MHKATKQQQQELVSITLKSLAKFVNLAEFCNRDEELFNAACVEQHMQDIAHMCDAVEQFAKTADLEEFLDAVYSQDTFVRDYYINTIRAIEDHGVEA